MTEPNARLLARTLLARETAGNDTPDAAAAAGQRSCECVYRELSRWLGAHGSSVLFARALTRARAEHAVLAGVRVRDGSDVCLDGFVESVRGLPPTTAIEAAEAILSTLVELLDRVIGDDMTATILGPCLPDGTSGSTRSASPEETS
ncbi:MAG: hypothetical protein ACRENI_08815 [Gemmatimonadaceae bacterium]